MPGETKVWQYITLMKSIYLIDCPGTVQPSGNSEVDAVLKGVVRIEQLREAQEFVDEVLRRVSPDFHVSPHALPACGKLTFSNLLLCNPPRPLASGRVEPDL